jgi:hypothetical protein
VYFELSVLINRPPAHVFTFLRDKDKHPQEEGSPVLLLEKTTPDPPCEGTCYREVVQMLPFYRGEILSEITCFEPNEHLEEDFRGAGMYGHLAYQFLPEKDGTKLIQRETLHYQGLLRLCEPVIRVILDRRLHERLEDIKAYLEGDFPLAG